MGEKSEIRSIHIKPDKKGRPIVYVRNDNARVRITETKLTNAEAREFAERVVSDYRR